MAPKHFVCGLAHIALKGVRTAQMREIDGIPLVLSPEIPTGTFALRTADRITVHHLETGLPVVAVLCEADGISARV